MILASQLDEAVATGMPLPSACGECGERCPLMLTGQRGASHHFADFRDIRLTLWENEC